jgi:hypothetical protein
MPSRITSLEGIIYYFFSSYSTYNNLIFVQYALPWFIQYWKEAVPVLKFCIAGRFLFIYSFLPVIIADSILSLN